jgi:hypothetical protein
MDTPGLLPRLSEVLRPKNRDQVSGVGDQGTKGREQAAGDRKQKAGNEKHEKVRGRKAGTRR